MRLYAVRIVIAGLFMLASWNSRAQFEYISPQPGTSFHNPSTNILLRNAHQLDYNSLQKKNLFKIKGSVSGNHVAEPKLINDGTEISLQPVVPFTEGETVTVTIGDDIRTTNGIHVTGTSFTFEIHPKRTPEIQQQLNDALRQIHEEEFGPAATSETRDGNAGLPDFNLLTNTTTSPGDVFFHNFNLFGDKDSHYCIIKNNGDSVYGKFDTVVFNNFSLNHNGYMTAYNKVDSTFVVLDSSYNQVKEVQMGNGYKADVHEFQMYNDKIFMLSYDAQIFDMSIYNPNYPTNATVIGCVIQELDPNYNVIFQWRSWDHFQVTDATHISFFNLVQDYVHANALEFDNDGNLLLSCRHMDEITKINLNTGAIIWRLGGKNNQFNFLNDPDKFSYQHDVRRIANGHITLFDNGNFHSPARSYAKEYSLDEINKTATLAWSYSRTVAAGNVYSNAMGSVQRLSNGNTFICWGLTSNISFPSITEVDPNNNVVWELQLLNTSAIYRAQRHEWDPCARPTPKLIKIKGITATSAKVSWATATNASSYNLEYKKLSATTWTDVNTMKLNKKLTGLSASTKYQVRIRAVCDQLNGTSSAWSTKQFITLPQKPITAADDSISSFELYPNPNDGHVYLYLDLNDDEAITLNIYDMSGRLVYSASHLLNTGEQTLSLNLQDLPAGLYFADIKTIAEQVVRKLVIE